MVDLSPGRQAGEDMADKVRFWSPEAQVEVMAPEKPAGGKWDLVIIIHDGLMYRRGRRLLRAVKSQLPNTPLVATFDRGFQRVWRIDRDGYGAFSRRAWVYPYLLAVVRRLPAPLRRPILGTQ